MAFLLRQISYSAEGREIIRPSRINDDLLRIGRDPEMDIRLNDLAVALKHCVIEVINERQLGVSAETGLTVELDGRSTNFGKINLAQGGDIRSPATCFDQADGAGLGRHRDRCREDHRVRHPPR
jgi:pSer/pThr/pTyr-binding forkhead associated (FHA) protein